jgi:hypothetical protein
MVNLPSTSSVFSSNGRPRTGTTQWRSLQATAV